MAECGILQMPANLLFENKLASYKTPARDLEKYTKGHVPFHMWGTDNTTVWPEFLSWYNNYIHSSRLEQLHRQTKYDLFQLITPTRNLNSYKQEDANNIYEIISIFAREKWCDNNIAFLHKALGTMDNDFSMHVWKSGCYYTMLESGACSKLMKMLNRIYATPSLHHRLYWMQAVFDKNNLGTSPFNLFFVQQKGLKLYQLLESTGCSGSLMVDVLLTDDYKIGGAQLPSI